MHPYEIDVHELRALKAAGMRFSAKTHFMQSLFRSRIEGRLRKLFQSFEFATMTALMAERR